MVKEAMPVAGAMIPVDMKWDGSRNWLIFPYEYEDKPWKWPKAIKYDGRFFIWMSWNSDNMRVNYKECLESELAFPVKKKK